MDQSVFAGASHNTLHSIWLTLASQTEFLLLCLDFCCPSPSPHPPLLTHSQCGDLLLPWYTNTSWPGLWCQKKIFVILIKRILQKGGLIKCPFLERVKEKTDQIVQTRWTWKYFVRRNSNCITMAQRWAFIRLQPIRDECWLLWTNQRPAFARWHMTQPDNQHRSQSVIVAESGSVEEILFLDIMGILEKNGPEITSLICIKL